MNLTTSDYTNKYNQDDNANQILLLYLDEVVSKLDEAIILSMNGIGKK